MFFLTIGGLYVYSLGNLDRSFKDVVDQDNLPVDLHDHGYGKPMTVTSDHPLTSVTALRLRRGEITGYTLCDPAEESAKWPLNLTREQWDAIDDEDGHYRAIFADAEPEAIVIDLSSHQPWPLDGDAERPTLPDGASWLPATTWTDLFGMPSHDHLIPGSLTGFHGAAITLVREHPSFLPPSFPSEPRIEKGIWGHAEFTFFHSDGLSTTVKQGRRKMKRPLRETIRVDLTIGADQVPGSSLADAIDRWNERLAAVAAQLLEPSLVCATCRGLGFVRPTKETP